MNFVEMMGYAILSTDGSEQSSIDEFKRDLLSRNDPQLVWEFFEHVQKVLLHRTFEQAKWLVENSSDPVSLADHETQTGLSQSGSDETPSSGSAALSTHETHQQTSQPDPDEMNSETAALLSGVTLIDSSQSVSEPLSPKPVALNSGIVSQVNGRQSGSGDTKKRVSSRAVIRSAWQTPIRDANSAAGVIMHLGGRKSEYDNRTNHHGIPYGELTAIGLKTAAEEEKNPLYRIYAELLDNEMPQTGRAKDRVRAYISPDRGDELWREATKLAEAA